ncbi:hypothetical protein PAXRUDRAFT_830468 [Paxillus rubicundulus Ve08.2h10]|uniref:Pinin/SDK/MemA protein domain-containing protein n=1 Tax=Paxillus rubicundulus Ve08.2h10 TaxID=930991 RepID=A0A0D0DTI7_9AGAM|nr:hypothetical protein PAXRUDRAFT_830468 [Paxillus rubicundulus Ve08.2h10]
MSSEEPIQDVQVESQDVKVHEPPTAPAAMASANKRRPKIDLGVLSGERRRGKSMFGIVLGTLNKAKIEDKERNASEAAKKRQLIEQRLQTKLRKETDSVRRAEEAKKDKNAANRKEEELQLKDSIYKVRHARLPLLTNFLVTSDIIPSSDSSPPPLSSDPLAQPLRSHPPPLYYLPAILTPAQETFLARRKAEVTEAIEKEWLAFCEERTAGIEEIKQLRQRVSEEDTRRKKEREAAGKGEGEDKEMTEETDEPHRDPIPQPDAEMEVDEGVKPESAPETRKESAEPERKDESAAMQADDEDAVEY